MKKIIATVLAMVMALALCTTAFAATTAEVSFGALQWTSGTTVGPTSGVATFHKAVNPVYNDDDEQTNTANIGYYTVDDTITNLPLVAVDTKAEADLILYNNSTDKSVVLYLALAIVEYNGAGTVFTDFGKKCGQVNYAGYDATETYYTSNAAGDNNLYVADEDGEKALMVSGKLVTVSDTNQDTEVVKHVAVATVKDGKVTGYTCSKCGMVAVKAANVASIPTKGVEVIDGTWYFPAQAAAVDTTTDTTTTSPKTFDAGIAMYVGMALTSVAGSAVVIGKKKEF